MRSIPYTSVQQLPACAFSRPLRRQHPRRPRMQPNTRKRLGRRRCPTTRTSLQATRPRSCLRRQRSPSKNGRLRRKRGSLQRNNTDFGPPSDKSFVHFLCPLSVDAAPKSGHSPRTPPQGRHPSFQVGGFPQHNPTAHADPSFAPSDLFRPLLLHSSFSSHRASASRHRYGRESRTHSGSPSSREIYHVNRHLELLRS
jgi:hypothetical protein